MAVAPDAQKLKVDSSSLPDRRFIRRAILIVIAPDSSIGNVDVARVGVDVRKKIFLHEMMKTLRMRGGKAEILIKIKGHHA